jgi:deoxyadenosine/deoxycytidine kinase
MTTQNQFQIQIVSIEGNIGSGKSTLLANLKKHFKDHGHIVFLKEPVDEWSKIKDENGTTILEKFYADQEKYSFPFQMMAYVSRLKLLKDTIQEYRDSNGENGKLVIITERSLYTDKMVFAKMLYDSKKIEFVNYQIYLNWFDAFAEEYPVHKIIYVKTDPENCYNRIATRQRDGEDKIPLEYLKTCSEYHDNMLDSSSADCVCNKQLLLDGNHNIYQNTDVLATWIRDIEQFIR